MERTGKQHQFSSYLVRCGGPSHRHTQNALRSAPKKRTPIAWTGEHPASSSLERGLVLVCDSRQRHKPLLEHVNLVFVQKVSSFQEKKWYFHIFRQSGNFPWAPPVPLFWTPEHTGHCCSVERRTELEKANTGKVFSIVSTWNPLYIFRYKISWAK